MRSRAELPRGNCHKRRIPGYNLVIDLTRRILVHTTPHLFDSLVMRPSLVAAADQRDMFDHKSCFDLKKKTHVRFDTMLIEEPICSLEEKVLSS
jgi:hypothetical protein